MNTQEYDQCFLLLLCQPYESAWLLAAVGFTLKLWTLVSIEIKAGKKKNKRLAVLYCYPHPA